MGVDEVQVRSHEQLTGRLHEYTLFSPSLEREATVRVHLPSAYEAEPDRAWPMALLLHGRSENGTTWSEQVDLDQFDDIVFVMPDGGLVGWYTDWVDDSGFDPQRWETFHIDEVLPWADATLRIAPGRSQRFVAGDSMGGYGAMAYAALYPDRFGGAAELSGFVDLLYLESSGMIGVDGQSAQTYQVPPGAIFGDRTTDEVIWRGNNPVDLAENLAWTDLVLRHGNGLPGEHGGNPDAGEAAIRLTGISFHDRLDELGIDHLWDDFGNGTHIWPYWEEGLQIAMPRWLDLAAADAPAPVPFSYTTIEPDFSVHGFDVTLDRQVAEFATLTDVAPAGFTLTGSGTATVMTTGWYEPDRTYEIAQGGTISTVVADGAGRLTIPVDLGPSHTAQQFTPEASVAEAAAGDGYFTTVANTITAAGAVPREASDTDGAEGGSLPTTGGGLAGFGMAVLAAAHLARRTRTRDAHH